MKRIFLILAIASISLCFASCSGEKINKSSTKQYPKMVKYMINVLDKKAKEEDASFKLLYVSDVYKIGVDEKNIEMLNNFSIKRNNPIGIKEPLK